MVTKDRAGGAAVFADFAVVPHDEVTVGTDDDEGINAIVGIGAHTDGEVGFGKALAIDPDGAVLELEAFAGEADDAFDDEILTGVVANDDEVAASGCAEEQFPAVEEVTVAMDECGGHAAALDDDRGDDELADNKVACDGADNEAEPWPELTPDAGKGGAPRAAVLAGAAGEIDLDHGEGAGDFGFPTSDFGPGRLGGVGVHLFKSATL